MPAAHGWLLVLTMAASAPAFVPGAAQPQAASQHPEEQPLDEVGVLRIGDLTALRLPAAGSFSAQQRVEHLRRLLLQALQSGNSLDLSRDLRVGTRGGQHVVSVRDQPVVTVTAADTRLHGLPADQLAHRYADGIRRALTALATDGHLSARTLQRSFQTAVISREDAGEPEAVTASRDETIVSGIRHRLANDPTFRRENLADELAIESHNGRVTLRGTVRSRGIEARLIDQVQRMPGVEAVVNQIEVSDPASPE